MSKFHYGNGYRRTRCQLVLPVIPEDVEADLSVSEDLYQLCQAKFSQLDEEHNFLKVPRLSPPRSRSDNKIRMKTDIPQLVNWQLDTYPQDLEHALTWAH